MFKEPGWNDPPMNKQSGALDMFGGEAQHHEIKLSTQGLVVHAKVPWNLMMLDSSSYLSCTL